MRQVYVLASAWAVLLSAQGSLASALAAGAAALFKSKPQIGLQSGLLFNGAQILKPGFGRQTRPIKSRFRAKDSAQMPGPSDKPARPSLPATNGQHACDERSKTLSAQTARATVEACRQAVKAHPDIWGYADKLGRALYQQGDYHEAIGWLRKAADRGVAGAMNMLTDAYVNGHGVPVDYQMALQWSQKAVLLKYAPAYYSLGLLHMLGYGVPRNDARAVNWFSKAAHAGHAGAMNLIGFALWNGRGIERDQRQGVAWYRKSATKGSAAAMNNLGLAYRLGRGVDRNDTQAVSWYRKAANKGDRAALFNLAISYYSGRGVKKNLPTALRYLKRATAREHPRAMAFLGLLYARGYGVKRNTGKAVDLAYRALKAGDAFARKELTSNAGSWGAAFRKAFQRRLRSGGHYKGPIDGGFGRGTLAAITSVAGRSRPPIKKLSSRDSSACRKYVPRAGMTVSIDCPH